MLKNADLIRVIYPTGTRARSVSSKEAKQLIRAGVARSVGKDRHLRCIQLFEGPSRPVAGTTYSHKSKTEFNPPNVWDLRRITHLDRAAFMQVQTDCLVGAR